VTEKRIAGRRKLSGISVVFPTLDDGGTIGSMVLAARAAVEQSAEEYEIIVVENGSRDYTAGVLAELARRVPELRVIRHPRPLGYGGAVRAGFEQAAQEWIFYTDGDAQYNPLELTRLVEAAADGVDVVNGYKIRRRDRWYRIILGQLYHSTVRLLFGFRLRDVDCDFRLIRRTALGKITLHSTSGIFALELVKRLQDAGCSFVEIPVSHYPRRYGRSQFFRLGSLIDTARELAVLWARLVLHGDSS
jgi:glycosyltransferase involved in cell wall biosynthesis